ncbi:MAG: helix-turn-helix domain-containing protein [Kiritimatiellae bacterium]|nr:helix-turn-helix domain-containing protein [Kiritimatiellia bacterium]
MDTKTKRRTPPREPGYHRLTDEKRIIIETLRKEGRSLAYIAERIGCSKSTVSKEIKRNKSKRGYRHKKANGQARARVAAKAAKRRKFTPEMWDYAITHLRDDGWTFEQSCGRARRDGIPMVCKETLYQEYYRREVLVRKGLSRRSCPRCRVARRGGLPLPASRPPLRGRLHPSSRAGLAFGAHQVKPSAEARFAGLTENCYTTN